MALYVIEQACLVTPTLTDRIAANLTRLMDAAEINQTELAARLNNSQPAVSQWLKGKTAPRVDQWDDLARILGCDVADLIKPLPSSTDAGKVSVTATDKAPNHTPDRGQVVHAEFGPIPGDALLILESFCVEHSRFASDLSINAAAAASSIRRSRESLSEDEKRRRSGGSHAG